MSLISEAFNGRTENSYSNEEYPFFQEEGGNVHTSNIAVNRSADFAVLQIQNFQTEVHNLTVSDDFKSFDIFSDGAMSSETNNVPTVDLEKTKLQRSLNKYCQICTLMVKERNKRFGILVNCKHVFCVGCIRKRRRRKQRTCPVCRISSPFFVPHKYWIEDDLEKLTLVENYETYMSTKQCKFNRRTDRFGERKRCTKPNCYYRH